MIKNKLPLNRINRIISAIVGENNISIGESVRLKIQQELHLNYIVTYFHLLLK